MIKFAILAIGYILAVPPLLVLIPVLNKPAHKWPGPLPLAAEFAGASLIAVGWFSLGMNIGGIINTSWVGILGGLWIRALRKDSPSK